ncbi:MAG: FKBP-type peptidyl-prolyl cis-trans isomerase [Bacteroidales bacterium]|nr:FKBP-type peptidyl-prolyl cis-trans isomerase [Bacteroidales bacterium]
MKRSYLLFAMACLSAMMLFTACTQKFPGYKKTQSGLYYKFHSQNTSATQPQLTDFMKVDMTCYLNDSLYYDWQGAQHDVYTQLRDPIFKGDLQEAYAMMHVGDSASFYLKADSVAALYYEQDPNVVGLKPEDYFRYEVKLVEVKSEEEFMAELETMKEMMKEASQTALADYIEANNINVTPEPSGVYIIPMEKGKGRCPVKGEKVELDFSATLLDGRSVGSTFDSPEKLSFVLGEGTTIQGWEEVVPKMHLGERVKAIIPFDLAYGERAVGSIPAYANLVYDIKLLKITTAAELKAENEKAIQVLKADSEKAFFDYLKANDITDYTASGLFFNKSVTTEGAQPQEGQIARIKFAASYLDGTQLGDSEQLGDYYDIVVGEGKVLKGLEEAVAMMRVGEKARFVLPYTLAYGTNAFGSIPAYSNLVFDVELLDVLDK